MENRNHVGALFLAGIVAISAVGIAFVSTRLENTEPKASVVVNTTPAKHSVFAESDEDGDGLPAWKEALVGTDPNNPDSDGDGVWDGDEVSQSADPLKEGSEAVDGSAYVAPRALPTTEAVARELFTTYAEARSDGTLDSSEVAQGVSAVIERNVLAKDLSTPRYTRHDIAVESDVNPAAYESSVSSAFRTALDVREYELNVFARAVSSNSNTELQKLLVTAAVYESIRDRLLALEVPEGVADEHLRVVNELSAVAGAVRSLAGWGGDPLDALSLVNNFSDKEQRFSATITDLYTLIPILKKQSS